MRNPRRLWYAVPGLGLGLAFALPRDDAFAFLDRTGHAILPRTLTDAAPTPPRTLQIVDPPMAGCRVRAWRIDRSRNEVIRTLESRGLSGSRVRWRRNAVGSIELESQTLYAPLTWARITVLSGDRWGDHACLVRLEEPQDGPAVWNRLVARIQRGAMR